MWRGSAFRASLREPLRYGGVLLVVFAALAVLLVGAASGQSRAAKDNLRIALILPDFTKNSAILGVKQGAEDEAKKLGNVTLITTGSGSADGQVKAVENAIAAKVDAILYDSISGNAFTNAVKEANKAGIPVVCYVSCAPGGKQASKIDFDFKAIGVPLGKWTATDPDRGPEEERRYAGPRDRRHRQDRHRGERRSTPASTRRSRQPA